MKYYEDTSFSKPGRFLRKGSPVRTIGKDPPTMLRRFREVSRAMAAESKFARLKPLREVSFFISAEIQLGRSSPRGRESAEFIIRSQERNGHENATAAGGVGGKRQERRINSREIR